MKVPHIGSDGCDQKIMERWCANVCCPGNLTGATTKDFIRAVPAKNTACALGLLAASHRECRISAWILLRNVVCQRAQSSVGDARYQYIAATANTNSSSTARHSAAKWKAPLSRVLRHLKCQFRFLITVITDQTPCSATSRRWSSLDQPGVLLHTKSSRLLIKR